ncbi:hypothetical protein COLO4_16469 [Corchorus olitorius]|uniref:Uncharacterized protein n=1 Tax=Corchorus olitorius TaxID=93759 RepID=A0A1R3JH88_9ROSI|nr:hypothetical protein COLO4_16469 [Corchorus olitorius]
MLAGWCGSELIADMARWALKASWSLFVANQGLPTW